MLARAAIRQMGVGSSPRADILKAAGVEPPEMRQSSIQDKATRFTALIFT
jgi:hypothetical protein